MSARRALGWVALAVTGLVLAVAVTTFATEITSQRIGLESEPLSAGDELAPRPARRDDAPEPAPTPAESDDDEDSSGESGDSGDDGGRGRGRGRGRGGDDDD